MTHSQIQLFSNLKIRHTMEPDVSSVKQNYECQTVEKLQVLGQSTDQSGNINSEKECAAFILLASAVAALSGLLVGYEMAVISGALLQLQDTLAFTCQKQEMVVSSLLFGALLSSLFGGFIIDKYGRRIVIIGTSFLILIGSIVLICVMSYTVLIIGRILVGIAISLSCISTCLYLAEIAPQNRRGLLVSLNELMIVFGVLLAYAFNYVFATVSNGWKYMFGLVIPPAFLQAAAMFFLPVSPRFLIKKGENESASYVLTKLRASTDINEELNSITASLKEEQQYSFWDLFSSKDNMRTRLLIGVILVIFHQATGQPNILYYASTILKSVGFHSNNAATLASTGIGAVKVASTIPAVLFVDRLGSRTFLLIGSAVMAVSLTTMGIVSLRIPTGLTSVCVRHTDINQTHWINNATGDFPIDGTHFLEMASQALSGLKSTTNLTTPSKRKLTSGDLLNETLKDTPVKDSKALWLTKGIDRVPGTLKWLSLACLLVYIAAFSISLGPMVWLVLSEIFPLGIRGRAMSVVVAVSWAVNLLVSMTFLTVIEKIGLPYVLFIYAVMSFALLVFVFVFIPETKGQSLEQISKKLAEKKYIMNDICCKRMPETQSEE
ncbi:solute carrier family 2, facilitated glucose transporter member 12 isoform X1 [Acipenser ruthenus]|uniref:solute carrier family 2, facilitated glucose transporter member 12 isoform X1 n=2 Tax=Acipenser ruthenus TaxID=7906 RepID=UPI0027428B20|nr:solute carrier family 2, facilitated glucose transporter member 12 isoform X1 [Acipenser ruthenus]